MLLLLAPGREFSRGLRRGIVEYATKHGPWILLEPEPSYVRAPTARGHLHGLHKLGADGVIVSASLRKQIGALRLPAVVAVETERRLRRGYQVVCDNEAIGSLGAKTLLGLGLQQFAYCGWGTLEFSVQRLEGFRRTLEDFDRPVYIYDSAPREAASSWHAETLRLARWVTSIPKPIGVMACNDDRARMLAEICLMEHITVPDEVALLGVDDDESICKSARPALSSIALATEQAGYEAAGLLAAIMAGSKPATPSVKVAPTHAVARRSTDVLAIEDLHVGRALRYIRENSNRKLQVADLLAVSGVSRRALQDAFLKALGRTPLEEIHNSRVVYIARLLVETDLPVSKIAEAAGFAIDAHLSRFFARRAGMSPLAYRKKHRIS